MSPALLVGAKIRIQGGLQEPEKGDFQQCYYALQKNSTSTHVLKVFPRTVSSGVGLMTECQVLKKNKIL